MADGTDIASDRAELYGALRRRNRTVSLLRVLVPAICLGLLGILGVQIVITNMTKDFTLGQVSIDRGRLMVDGPTYSGALNDGSLYKVVGTRAYAAINDPSLIELEDATVSLKGTGGQELTANAALARLDSTKQTVTVPGVTTITDSSGMEGNVEGLHIDYPAQFATSTGPVHITFSGGETLDAAEMHFDAAGKLWRFKRATIVIPTLPGSVLQ